MQSGYDERMAALERRMQQSTPDEMRLMGLQMLHAMQGELPDLTPPDGIPEDLAGAATHLQSLQRQVIDEINQEIAGLEALPEVQAMIEAMKKKMQKPI